MHKTKKTELILSGASGQSIFSRQLSRMSVTALLVLFSACRPGVSDKAASIPGTPGDETKSVASVTEPASAADERSTGGEFATAEPDDLLVDKESVDEGAAGNELDGLAIRLELDGGAAVFDIDKPMQVILTNTSDEPLCIWTDATENGYYKYSLRFRNLQTGEMHIARKRRITSRDYWESDEDSIDPAPKTSEIAPHASLTQDVELTGFAWGERAWNRIPAPNSGDTFEISVQLRSDTQADPPRRSVWTGRILSKPVTARLVAPRLTTPHHYLWNGFPEAAIAMMSADPAWVSRRDDMQCTPLHHAARFGHAKAVQWLLDHGADATAVAYNGFTPLYFAEDPRIVEKILQKRPDLSLPCDRSHTPLQHAAARLARFSDAGHADERAQWRTIVDLYLRSGADFDVLTVIYLDDLPRVQQVLKEHPEFADNFQEQSLLRTAAGLGRLEICRYLIEKYPVNVDDFDRGVGYPIIKEALAHPRIVELLIRHEANLQRKITWRGFRTGIWIVGDEATVLHHAADDGVPETITLLIDNGVDVFAAARKWSDKGLEQTALEVAAYFGKADNALAIVSHPEFRAADRNRRQAVLDRSLHDGVYPSWLARDADRVKLVRVLLDAGADPNVAEKGVTAMQVAARSINPTSRRQNSEIREIVALLAEHGATIDIFSAVAIGDQARVRQLLEDDPALANARGPGGYPALHFAVGMNYREIVSSLLAAGCDVDIRNTNNGTGSPGGTALHCAAFWGRYEIAKSLIAAGADVNARTEGGDTPLGEALRLKSANVERLLRENGARLGDGEN